MRRILTIIAALVLTMFALTACAGSGDKSDGQQKEDTSRQSNYDKLIAAQPAHGMQYSPTRDTKNFWIDTWNHKGKLSYVYLRNSSGEVFGYYVLQGLPVSYCTSLIPPYQIKDYHSGTDSWSPVVVPGPSIDGTYSSSSNCSEFYGKDAVSGAYVEYSVGMGINQQISDQPLPQYGDAEPLASATVKNAK